MDSFKLSISSFLKEEFNLRPSNIDVFLSAFTHSSFKLEQNFEDYERLELLGDACIGLVITNFLYELNIPLKEMCNFKKEIVSGSSLKFISQKFQLHKYLRLGKSCLITDSLMEDLYESFIGAVYLSFGFDTAKKIISDTLWKSYLDKELPLSIDYKTRLQEKVQVTSKDRITYSRVKTTKDSKNIYSFEVNVAWGGQIRGKGIGSRLKQAEQNAAKDALNKFFNLDI